jgi:hypothetical protein
LPAVAGPKSAPNLQQYIRFTQRPWVGTCFFGFEEPVENMPQYGLEYGRIAGIAALLLCTDLPRERKEPLLINYVQVGIDLGGMIRAEASGWTCWGGHGSGRKLPIVFACLLLAMTSWLPGVGTSRPQAAATSISPFPRQALARMSKPVTATHGPVLKSFSPDTPESTPLPVWVVIVAMGGGLMNTRRLQNGKKVRTRANRIAAVALASVGWPRLWLCA